MKCAQVIRLLGLICLLAAFITPSHGAEPLRRAAAPSKTLQPAARVRMDPNLQAFRLELAAYRQDLAALERRAQRMKARQQRLRTLAAKLQGVGDDAQLANVDLQDVLQKQQKTMEMMSNISKMMHDTAMAIIRKIGG